MSRSTQQHIVIVNRDGATTEFAGDTYRLITGPMGFRVVLDEHSNVVWTEPSIQAGGPAEVTVRDARPDYSPVLSADQAMGLAGPSVPPAVLGE
ncbi:hypothetical protein [Williamsia herbipolensis]|uniref:hypothetical protein n=1 Tax=Williamsia herbipolensis TaxID=1603258 RepID=UPI000AA6E6B9|nr:hypothetical protein [Williamsia herbipolensis]